MTSPHVNTNSRVDKNFTINITLFRDRFARFKQDKAPTLEGIANAIRKTKGERKEDLPLLKLATFGDMASPKDALRCDNNVLSVTGVELDYDGEKIPFDDARLLLLEADIACIIYTTPSHAEEKPRWRVLAPFSCKMPPAERTRMIARLNGVLHGVAHPESFSLSQSYYYGYVTEEPRVDVLDGVPINLREDLDAGAIGKHGKSAGANGHDSARTYTEMEELIRRIVSGESLHPSVLSIAGKMAARGDHKETCIEIVGGAFEAAHADRYTDARWKGDVLRAINYVWAKEEAKHTPENKQELPPDITLDDFYAYLPKHWYLYVPTQTLWPPATINSRLGKVDQLKATRWLDKNKAVSQMIWAPGAGRVVTGKHLIEGGWIDKPGAIVFNQYREPPINGGDPAKAKPWLNLIKLLYPNPDEHNHIIKVLAFKLQHPEIKINHAIVLAGGMRIGKDTILVPFKRALGYWNCVEARPTTIMSPYNAYMRSVLLVINETRDLGDTGKYQFYDHMKDVITSPPETTLVNDKYEKGTHVANVCLVIMTTNHRTDGLYLPAGDGRHFPVWSDIQKEDHDIDFFANHYDWLNNGGTNHVAAYLRSLDVSTFRPGAAPPLTSLFHEIVDSARPIEHSWLQDLIDDMGNPTVMTIAGLLLHANANPTNDPRITLNWQPVREWLANKGNAKAIPYRLDECGYIRVPKPKIADGRWKIDGRPMNIYGRKDMPADKRLQHAYEMAREHPEV